MDIQKNVEHTLLENYKPNKTGEFYSRAFVESISPTTILPFLQQEIETFITLHIRDHLNSNFPRWKNSTFTYVTYDSTKIIYQVKTNVYYYKIIKPSETREEIGTISLFPLEGKSLPDGTNLPLSGRVFSDRRMGARHAICALNGCTRCFAFSRFEAKSA